MILEQDTFAHVVEGYRFFPCFDHMGCKTMEEYQALVTGVYGAENMADVEFVTLEEGTELILSADRHYYTK